MAKRYSAPDASNVVLPADSPHRSQRIMDILRNSPAIRSAMNHMHKDVALLEPKQGIMIDKITVAKGGIDPPASSSTIKKGYDSLEASSKTGDSIKENSVKMTSTTTSTQTKTGKEFSVFMHAHEKKSNAAGSCRVVLIPSF